MRGVRNTYAPWAALFYAITAACGGLCTWLGCARPDVLGAALMAVLSGMAAFGFFLVALMATAAAGWEHMQTGRAIRSASEPVPF